MRTQVSLLRPFNEPGGKSLIVDHESAVLHRPAETPDAAKPGCSADCVPILR